MLESTPRYRVGVRTMQWELTKRFTRSWPKVSGACREFVESLSRVSAACRGLRVRREHAKDDREHARMMSGVRWKKTKRLAGRSSGVVEKLTGSQEGLVGLDGHIDCR
ncbi:hypothetical protein B296_00032813 [Ensete ventricosum]|uniref:Uncharacterized protein n=1 Tax=Ensete ventricosum TaxID=4639 RepID=A0A426YFJ7_ENSVE|nr:hypothetical protein B296_00032813 [Ensete ventricosum]